MLHFVNLKQQLLSLLSEYTFFFFLLSKLIFQLTVANHNGSNYITFDLYISKISFVT